MPWTSRGNARSDAAPATVSSHVFRGHTGLFPVAVGTARHRGVSGLRRWSGRRSCPGTVVAMGTMDLLICRGALATNPGWGSGGRSSSGPRTSCPGRVLPGLRSRAGRRRRFLSEGSRRCAGPRHSCRVQKPRSRGVGGRFTVRGPFVWVDEDDADQSSRLTLVPVYATRPFRRGGGHRPGRHRAYSARCSRSSRASPLCRPRCFSTARPGGAIAAAFCLLKGVGEPVDGPPTRHFTVSPLLEKSARILPSR
jgi:hypothetical protein